MSQLRQAEWVPAFILSGAPIDEAGGFKLSEELSAEYDAMSDCQICDWAGHLRINELKQRQLSRPKLADLVHDRIVENLIRRQIKLDQCPRILGQ